MSEAQKNARKLDSDLDDLRQGKPARHSVTVNAAFKERLGFREQNKLENTKAKLMVDKLAAWCDNYDVLLLTELTPERVIRFRMSLPFRTGNSSSLSVHWSLINAFFNWCVGMGYSDKNPSPSTKQNPQFAIRYKKPEVVPPTKQQTGKILHTATGRAQLLCQLMRESALALVDAQKFGMSPEDARKFGLSKPERSPRLENGTLIRGNRTKTNEMYRVRISSSLAKRLAALGSPAFPGSYCKWREDCYKAFRDAGVQITPHGFRHYRISEWLALGVRVEDVADIVGTSPKEIRKTYRHWIKEAEDQLDGVQRQAWLAQGLDEDGNSGRSYVIHRSSERRTDPRGFD